MKKRNIFFIILGFVLGTVISTITATYAATVLSSKNVHYDNSNSGGSSTNVAGAIDELYATADDQDLLKSKIKEEMIDLMYPVGSVYITTTDSTVDAVKSRFGGTWVRYATDTTLVGYKEGTNTVNATGGSKTTTLSTTNLPNHTHTTPSTSLNSGLAASAGDHNHISYYVHGYTGWVGNTPQGFYAFKYNTSLFANGGLAAITGTSAFMNTSNNGNHTHTVTGTIPSMTTNSCTNCSSTPVNVQNPFTVVYMYKRTA